jgi:hypothetical protein
MHSLNHAVLGRDFADERSRHRAVQSVHPRRPERPPNVPVRGRAAFVAGRFARRLDPEMARRAVV